MRFKLAFVLLLSTGLATVRAQSTDTPPASAETPPAPALTLDQAMALAASNSIDIAVQASALESSRQALRRTGSAFWPQVSGHAQYWQIDKDRAEASFGSQPEDRTYIGVGASQVLYDDQVMSTRRSAKRNYEGALADTESVRLDAMTTAGLRYLDLLSAQAVHRIDLDNLKLTESNLDLARLRHKVGTAGPEEVYRWEAQEARQRGAAIKSESAVASALNALNQALGVDQQTAWQPQEIELADDAIYFLGTRLDNVLLEDGKLDALQAFSVEEALRNSPSLQSMDFAIQAQQIVLGQFRRKGYVPSIGASITYDHILDQSFVGPSSADASGGGIPISVSSQLDDNEWIFAVTASLPLFEGGGRLAQVAQARADLDRLVRERERARELTEVRVRAAFHAARSSQPNIGLSRIAADRAQKNLAVIRDRYASGSVSILDLLDAQNQSQVEAQTAAIAVHRYLRDLTEYQRALGWFEIDHTEADKDAWLRRFESFAAAHGATAP